MKNNKIYDKSFINILILSAYILGTILYVPLICFILFCGDKLDYYNNAKDVILLPNWCLTILIVPGLGICFLLYLVCKKLDKKIKSKFVIVGGLILLTMFYILIYKINVYVARCIAYEHGWDAGCVLGGALKALGGEALKQDGYFITYPNNIPIVYLFYSILKKVPEDYPYIFTFKLVEHICVYISITGMTVSVFTYRFCKKIFPTVLATLLYAALMLILPQKTVPYTDMYSLCFPILILTAYCFMQTIKSKWRLLLWLPIATFAIMGMFVKITVFIMLAVIIITEILRCMKELKNNKVDFLIAILLPVAVLLVNSIFVGYAEKQLGFEENKNYAVTWHHYYYMGLMDGTDGAFNSDAMTVITEYADKSVKERNKAEMQSAMEIIKNRSLADNFNHIIKKMVMTYNDGTFTWRGEGGSIFKEYPSLSESRFKSLFRSLFWCNGEKYHYFTTYCQYIWMCVLVTISTFWLGIIRRFMKCKNSMDSDDIEWTMLALAIALIGVFLYLLFFEARARYLINFIPVFIVGGTYGLWTFFEEISNIYKR